MPLPQCQYIDESSCAFCPRLPQPIPCLRTFTLLTCAAHAIVIGRNQLIAFVESQLPEVPAEYDHEPDVPVSFYYFAFEAESPSALIDKRDELRTCGVNVTDIVDHEWSKSIYFEDPHCLALEFCCAARSRTEEEAMPEPFTASHARTGSDACFDQSQQHMH